MTYSALLEGILFRIYSWRYQRVLTDIIINIIQSVQYHHIMIKELKIK